MHKNIFIVRSLPLSMSNQLVEEQNVLDLMWKYILSLEKELDELKEQVKALQSDIALQTSLQS